MLSVALLLAGAAASGVSAMQKVLNSYPNFQACTSQPSVFSCENTTAIRNTCCSPTPGCLVLQTQFWSTYTGLEKEGQLLPKDSWTIHGLWPDNADGSYNSYCDPKRQYDPTPDSSTTLPPYTGPSVETFIRDFGREDLLDFMNKYWINQGAPNVNFWAHEFSKHATCTSTFDVACYEPDYIEHMEVINFYDSVIRAWKQYPTYDMLASFGILPSNKTTYSLAQIENALTLQTGALPYLGCIANGTVLDEVWYFQHVYGTEQFGRFKGVNSTTKSSCLSTGIRYPERSVGSEHEVR